MWAAKETRKFFQSYKAARPVLGGQNSAKMISKVIGQKYVAIAKSWLPTMAVWGTTGGVALVYFTDWRLVLDYVPYINGKFKKDE
ncbi:cytochrome b-c1 complex subunit 10 [Archocentrus centrarchus]|nr:cytochrome b-c1 complex subunit 10-like [Archocentrus centrarchus]